jgi:hypothetical protein
MVCRTPRLHHSLLRGSMNRDLLCRCETLLSYRPRAMTLGGSCEGAVRWRCERDRPKFRIAGTVLSKGLGRVPAIRIMCRGFVTEKYLRRFRSLAAGLAGTLSTTLFLQDIARGAQEDLSVLDLHLFSRDSRKFCWSTSWL